eukprot:32879-Eustigmatos_ZCMA.PRE.1
MLVECAHHGLLPLSLHIIRAMWTDGHRSYYQSQSLGGGGAMRSSVLLFELRTSAVRRRLQSGCKIRVQENLQPPSHVLSRTDQLPRRHFTM